MEAFLVIALHLISWTREANMITIAFSGHCPVALHTYSDCVKSLNRRQSHWRSPNSISPCSQPELHRSADHRGSSRARLEPSRPSNHASLAAATDSMNREYPVWSAAGAPTEAKKHDIAAQIMPHRPTGSSDPSPSVSLLLGRPPAARSCRLWLVSASQVRPVS